MGKKWKPRQFPDPGAVDARCPLTRWVVRADDSACQFLDGDAVEIHDQTASLAALEIAHEGRDKWVGNWCWDDLLVSEEDALRLLGHLRRLGHWRVSEASETIYDAWEGGEPLTLDDLTED